ncbi:Tll0287-like domain-containing protein [Paraglaciecola arctica]|uniref:Tll0287-like domain-containing protein n=1 Tax=Paraglaciecola arctica BSs20135 TaxID=493475 RepID=K6YMF0_9ALTE|nr:DUF3365 domain-containing protein [Paraglaciecola arctica]GAC19337.1 hypothetical protein GARC_2371 [Paraglaciecola arctica BSs20135]
MNISRWRIWGLSLLSVQMFYAAVMAKEVNDTKQLDQVRLEFEVAAQQKIQSFASELKRNLSKAIQAGGFEEGVVACKDIAPSVAAKSPTSGWKVGRTSLKTRNKKNIPDTWERSILNGFESQYSTGSDIKSLIGFAEHIEQQTITLRYMKAIPVDGLCLSCHGENVSAEVKKILDEQYPNDDAIGYKIGDLRGAFTLSQTIVLPVSADD